jgi:hypothetical protein
MLEILMNPGEMTQAHWMILGILFILTLGILFFVYRTYLVIKDSTKNTYKPNIGLSRLKESEQADDEKSDS